MCACILILYEGTRLVFSQHLTPLAPLNTTYHTTMTIPHQALYWEWIRSAKHTKLRQAHSGMLTILVKTTVNTNNNTLAKSIANTNTFVSILFTVYYIQQRSLFHGNLSIKLIEWLLSRKWQTAIAYSDMMLMSKHCSSIYFRCKTTVLAFTLSLTVMLLLTCLLYTSDAADE